MPLEKTSLKSLEQHDDFLHRHIGPNNGEIGEMLGALGMGTLAELVEKAIPANILSSRPLDLRSAKNEPETLAYIRELAARNQVFKSFIGMGYTDCVTPPVILRNLLENPAWYTAYTAYQPEISQGRLEGLLNFQTMVTDLTGMEIANASLLDEATAAAEAMTMCLGLQKKKSIQTPVFWAMDDCLPQTLEVLETRARPLAITLASGDWRECPLDENTFAILLQYPTCSGSIHDYRSLIEKAHERDILVVFAADLLSLLLLTSPGELGADVVVGSAQRFGVPMGFGGPHAAFFATRGSFKRSIPGRIVGVSVDTRGKPSLRLALQTREQHIRREKATSNICTSQVLLAVIAGMYAVYHGPRELRKIALRVHRLTAALADALESLGHRILSASFFDTIWVRLHGLELESLRQHALRARINLRYNPDGSVAITLDETTAKEDVATLCRLFGADESAASAFDTGAENLASRIPEALIRASALLTHPVFNTHHSETEMLRYLHRLANKDLSLTHSMIPLGSCTMKLNGAAEMIPITWPEFSRIHPFAPAQQTEGYQALIRELEDMLSEITGFPAISLQPNAGSQGEFAGLLLIRRYHESQGQPQRDICIIPSSAHGTNPASAVMAGMAVVVVSCDKDGNIDLADLAAKAEKHRDRLAALMITYPSTHGVFEESVTEICGIIHQNGGQVYMDGANLNALVGLCRPGEFGADVCHLNLHKTFCIPHGGGGPGIGPIGVAQHLKSSLPGHRMRPGAFAEAASSAVAAAPWGSASILPISWAYIFLMGRDGLKKATRVAILNANYLAHRLAPHYPVLYKGKNGLVAHECIIDLRPLKHSAGIEVDDVAKRLIDYGFHAPTMSWPVAGTLMIEPTESESKEELDRFCEAMIAIREEIREIEQGRLDRDNNPLKYAPHTVADLTDADWQRPYSRIRGVYPLPWLEERKFWPSVNRVDNVHGDRNLVCSCPPMEHYQ